MQQSLFADLPAIDVLPPHEPARRQRYRDGDVRFSGPDDRGEIWRCFSRDGQWVAYLNADLETWTVYGPGGTWQTDSPKAFIESRIHRRPGRNQPPSELDGLGILKNPRPGRR